MRISEKPAGHPPSGAEAERAALSDPASRRLPVPPRERKPALAALAVLLILGGALATTLLVMRTGDRVSAIRITRQIGAGQRMDPAAMEEVRIAGTGVDYVPWRARAQVGATFARVTIVPGTLLTGAMTSKASEELGAGKAIVGLALKAGQLPAGLKSGDRVQVIYVPARGATASRVLVDSALVHSVGVTGPNGTGGLVTIVVGTTVSPTVALYASSGEIALTVLPGAS